MTKVTMPDPAAWVRRHPDGALTAEFLEDAVIDSIRKESDAWLPLITTDQAKSYANILVKQALEEAADIADQHNAFPVYDAIRALISEENE